MPKRNRLLYSLIRPLERSCPTLKVKHMTGYMLGLGLDFFGMQDLGLATPSSA